MTRQSLEEQINEKDAKVCIVGLGQVGLPTALIFCKNGFSVIGHDINESLLSTLNSKKIPFEENGLQELLVESIEKGKFHTTSDIEEAVKKSDVIIICVATPLTDQIKPDLSALEKVTTSLSGLSLTNKLVIIESSIPPGTFSRLILPLIEKKNRLGVDFWAAFVPERLAPGQGLAEIQTTPRVIGHQDNDSGLLAKALYEKIISSQILLTNVTVAEISKLVENTFRDVNVAFANEVGLICERYGIDVQDVIKICNSHPRVKVLQPGPGVGGPCLPKDPYLLLNPPGKPQIESKLILDSRKINDSMPYHVIDLVELALRAQNKKISESTILILGTTYKANVSDTRLSPAKEIISQLVKKGCNVLVFDPKTKESFGGKPVSDIWAAVSASDVLVIVTDHDEFKKLDLQRIYNSMRKVPVLVDTRRIYSKSDAEKIGFVYLSVGYSSYKVK